MIFAAFGLLLFSFATLAIVYAQSQSLGGASTARRKGLVAGAGVTLQTDSWHAYVAACRTRSDTYYELGGSLWLLGLGALLLAVATLMSPFFPTVLLPASSVVAVGLGLLALRTPSGGLLGRSGLRLVGCLGVCGALFVVYDVFR